MFVFAPPLVIAEVRQHVSGVEFGSVGKGDPHAVVAKTDYVLLTVAVHIREHARILAGPSALIRHLCRPWLRHLEGLIQDGSWSSHCRQLGYRGNWRA